MNGKDFSVVSKSSNYFDSSVSLVQKFFTSRQSELREAIPQPWGRQEAEHNFPNYSVLFNYWMLFATSSRPGESRRVCYLLPQTMYHSVTVYPLAAEPSPALASVMGCRRPIATLADELCWGLLWLLADRSPYHRISLKQRIGLHYRPRSH